MFTSKMSEPTNTNPSGKKNANRVVPKKDER